MVIENRSAHKAESTVTQSERVRRSVSRTLDLAMRSSSHKTPEWTELVKHLSDALLVADRLVTADLRPVD